MSRHLLFPPAENRPEKGRLGTLLAKSALLTPSSERVGGDLDGIRREPSIFVLPALSVPFALSVSASSFPSRLSAIKA